jgi:hypothetical protein
MTSPASSVPGQRPGVPEARLAEAARYALLRRLAPSMRHHLVVNLQPIGMVYEIMDRRLRAPQPDVAAVQESAQKINGFARAALDSCLDVVTWLAPEEGAVYTATEGVSECLSLLATSLTFRGFALRNEVGEVSGQVRRSALRNVLAAGLMHITDETSPPAELVISADPTPAALKIQLTLRPNDGADGFSSQEPYRRLEWEDVRALAQSESVEVSREGQLQLVMSLPWVDG